MFQVVEGQAWCFYKAFSTILIIMPSTCVVGGCTRNKTKNPDIRFFSISADSCDFKEMDEVRWEFVMEYSHELIMGSIGRSTSFLRREFQPLISEQINVVYYIKRKRYWFYSLFMNYYFLSSYHPIMYYPSWMLDNIANKLWNARHLLNSFIIHVYAWHSHSHSHYFDNNLKKL